MSLNFSHTLKQLFLKSFFLKKKKKSYFHAHNGVKNNITDNITVTKPSNVFKCTPTKI